MPPQKTHTFHVRGMHCQACVVVTENELNEHEKITRVKASLNNYTVEVTGHFEEQAPEELAEELSLLLKPHGYTLALTPPEKLANWQELKKALPIALIFILLFIGLQKLGIVNLLSVSKVSYGSAFLIGLVASLSTCMAVVGGLVLSVSANFAKDGDRVKPQTLFHLGRLTSFFILGGIIGAIGSTFSLGTTGVFVLSFLMAVVLIILGINLLDLFSVFKKWQPTMPTFIGRRVHRLKNLNHNLTPLILGVATFFLPCGFTQSMQLYTLTTGNFWQGGITMLMFALGTLPMLALLSFSSFAISKKSQKGIFFKTAGLVVIFFGLFNLINSLVIIGWLPPIFNF
ncbi:MAG: sulfite exporter TauE/SafE family protein [Patescibacteria group bacterium]